MMDLAIVFSALNSVLLLVLLSLYLRIFLRRRASYSLGLMIFAAFLLVQNLMTAYSYASMTPHFGEGVLPFLFGMSLFEFGGLIALFRITV
jgi:hypothetical protein